MRVTSAAAVALVLFTALKVAAPVCTNAGRSRRAAELRGLRPEPLPPTVWASLTVMCTLLSLTVAAMAAVVLGRLS